MAPGGRPLDRPLPEVPGVFSQAAALHLVAPGDPHHQDSVLLHRPCFCERGTTASVPVHDVTFVKRCSNIYFLCRQLD